jgi:hypothetical protein
LGYLKEGELIEETMGLRGKLGLCILGRQYILGTVGFET